MADTTTDAALILLNQYHDVLATTARAVVTALADRKVTAMESLQIGMDAMQLGSLLLMTLRGAPPAVREALLTVLEQGHWTLDA